MVDNSERRINGPDANGRSTDLQSDCLGSIPTVSTKINLVIKNLMTIFVENKKGLIVKRL